LKQRPETFPFTKNLKTIYFYIFGHENTLNGKKLVLKFLFFKIQRKCEKESDMSDPN